MEDVLVKLNPEWLWQDCI